MAGLVLCSALTAQTQAGGGGCPAPPALANRLGGEQIFPYKSGHNVLFISLRRAALVAGGWWV
jgi:hypothetical protein